MTSKNSIKTLILVPAQDQLGGVYNFYENLKPHIETSASYFYVGEPKFIIKNKLVVFLIYLIKFIKILIRLRPGQIVLNTSLNLNAVFRDSIYALIAKIFKIKVIVFWRGWNFDNEKYLKYPYSILTKMLLKSNKAIVLYSEITNSLKKLGYTKQIFQLTTMVGDDAFSFNISKKNNNNFDLIFLSRIEIYKGVYELLDAYTILKLKHKNMRLIIAGSGSEYNNLFNKVEGNGIDDVHFVGYLKDQKKYELLASGDVFVFPSYSEGMPNAVLEAMALGMPVITTPVGGINDFFLDNEMGNLVTVKDVDSIITKVEYLYSNPDLRKTMNKTNKEFARQNFKGDVVYNKLRLIINL